MPRACSIQVDRAVRAIVTGRRFTVGRAPRRAVQRGGHSSAYAQTSTETRISLMPARDGSGMLIADLNVNFLDHSSPVAVLACSPGFRILDCPREAGRYSLLPECLLNSG